MTFKVIVGIIAAFLLYFVLVRGHMLMYFRFSTGEFLAFIAIACAAVWVGAKFNK